jgi:hypothetical protein
MWKVNQMDDKAIVIKVNDDSISPEKTPPNMESKPDGW